MKRYEYEVLNYWNDSDDLYVHYLVFDNKNKRKADCIDYYNISDIGYNYNSSTNAEIEESLLENIEQNNGIEFKYPKVSNLSKLLKYIYDSVCNSDSNMCHIDYDDWNTMKEDYNFEENDIKILEDEIKKYNLNQEDMFRYSIIEELENCYIIATYKNYQVTVNKYPKTS